MKQVNDKPSKSRGMGLSAHPERVAWNQENMKRVTGVLRGAGYHPGAFYRSTISGCNAAPAGEASIEFWIGPGAVPVIALQTYADDTGFDILTPLSNSNMMDVIIEALNEACKRTV